jgi:hypothetical protein
LRKKIETWCKMLLKDLHLKEYYICIFFFQTMLENYTFLPFSVFLAIFWVFTYKKVPETKNKTFDEIATLFKIQNKQK